MKLYVTWARAAGLAIVWGAMGCAHEREESQLPSRAGTLSATRPVDLESYRMARAKREKDRTPEEKALIRSKVSQYDRKAYSSNDFTTKSYQTGKATVGKPFKARSNEFNTAAYQTQNYGDKASPLGREVSPYAGDKARTKGFAQAGKVAPTTDFSGSDKEYSTERAGAEGRRFKSAKIKRRNDAAARAQEKSIQASDVSISKLAMGEAGPGTLGTSDESGRSWVRPRILSPYDPSPGTTLSPEEVRRILNRGQRPD